MIEILFFLAAFFAPEEAESFALQLHGSNSAVFVRTDEGWQREGGDRVWRIQEHSVMKGSREESLEGFFDGIEAHDWCEQSVLRLAQGFVVLKEPNGLVVYPNGLSDERGGIEITYQTAP